jgi:hypothetical protein
MTVLVVLDCGVCHGAAGIGFNVEHAESNLQEAGGRIIADLRVCKFCARHTR